MPFTIGPLEIAIVLVIALVVRGPKRLPDAGKSLGRGIREFRDGISGRSRPDDEPAAIEAGRPSSQQLEG
jgi:sec-independent protein translocase protein TatA